MVTNTDIANPFLQNTVISPLKLLDSDASMMCPSSSQLYLLPRYQSSHVLWEPIPTSKISGEDYATHIFLGPWVLVAIGTQIFLFAKFKEFILSK